VEGLITDYKADMDEHAIAYDINTPAESYEWFSVRCACVCLRRTLYANAPCCPAGPRAMPARRSAARAPWECCLLEEAGACQAVSVFVCSCRWCAIRQGVRGPERGVDCAGRRGRASTTGCRTARPWTRAGWCARRRPRWRAATRPRSASPGPRRRGARGPRCCPPPCQLPAGAARCSTAPVLAPSLTQARRAQCPPVACAAWHSRPEALLRPLRRRQSVTRSALAGPADHHTSTVAAFSPARRGAGAGARAAAQRQDDRAGRLGGQPAGGALGAV